MRMTRARGPVTVGGGMLPGSQPDAHHCRTCNVEVNVRNYVPFTLSGFHSTRRRRRTGRISTVAVAPAIAAVAVAAALGAGTAAAAPVKPATPQIDIPTADSPMPAGPGEFSYIATHAVTKRAAGMKVPEAIASLPVPAQYRPANLALAQQFDLALAGALASPGGCLQIVVDPRARSGSLFNYGFFPVSGEYCP